ncbi:Retinoid-inducible serine carboxypeptidase [Desmophyllum pertusum]|uniref:Retinoid-inducible serine carboxypeptidase n=1 Tax=Desmophyllum pertusum TaxID=174260 RepID=A0A9X0CV03_9CNID|nr:Retinoid-inducible serine carboxypeptidase [Desmophyllum pertusum]
MADAELLNALFFCQVFVFTNTDEAWNYEKVRDQCVHVLVAVWSSNKRSVRAIEKTPGHVLQGGPGGSSPGVLENFEELGPLTVELKARNTTWLPAANVLFVDNPVGARL